MDRTNAVLSEREGVWVGLCDPSPSTFQAITERDVEKHGAHVWTSPDVYVRIIGGWRAFHRGGCE